MSLCIRDQKSSQPPNACAPRILLSQPYLLRAQRQSFDLAMVAACKIDRGSTVTAAYIQHSKAWPNITQTGAMVEEIDLSLLREFVPAQEQTVVYVIAPEGPIDPCKGVVVFAD